MHTAVKTCQGPGLRKLKYRLEDCQHKSTFLKQRFSVIKLKLTLFQVPAVCYLHIFRSLNLSKIKRV